MKKVFIHIGLHKTASTFLQREIFPALQNTTYIDRKLIQESDAFSKLMFADDSLYHAKEVKQFISRWKVDRILLSSESLSGKPLFMHAINRTLIAKRLKELFPEAEIILFIRGQIPMLWSHYNQYVKGREDGTRTLQEFIWYPGKAEKDAKLFGKKVAGNQEYYNTSNFQIHLDTYKHYELISLYKSIFSNVHVFLFEDFVADQEKTIEILLSKIGDQLHGPIPVSSGAVNQSLNYPSLLRKRKLNRIYQMTGNSILRKLGKGLVNMIPYPKEPGFEMVYLEAVAGDYFNENNRKIISEFPEIGLQNYPDKYRI